MPTPDLSLAAAAAAADAYFKVSPAGRLGKGAGFMVVSLGIDGGGGMVFKVASAGRAIKVLARPGKQGCDECG